MQRKNPAKVEQRKLKLVATEHIKTRESRGYVGAYISQVSDLILRVESFTGPTVAYDVEIDFTWTPTGHIVQCSCKYFYMHRSCCKQIALVEMEAPPITFLRLDFWNHQANFHLGMLKPEEQDDSNNAAPVLDLLDVLVQRFGHLLELRDRNVDYPQGAQVQRELEQTLSLFEATFPRKQGQDLNNKRPRQLY